METLKMLRSANESMESYLIPTKETVRHANPIKGILWVLTWLPVAFIWCVSKASEKLGERLITPIRQDHSPTVKKVHGAGTQIVRSYSGRELRDMSLRDENPIDDDVAEEQEVMEEQEAPMSSLEKEYEELRMQKNKTSDRDQQNNLNLQILTIAEKIAGQEKNVDRAVDIISLCPESTPGKDELLVKIASYVSPERAYGVLRWSRYNSKRDVFIEKLVDDFISRYDKLISFTKSPLDLDSALLLIGLHSNRSKQNNYCNTLFTHYLNKKDYESCRSIVRRVVTIDENYKSLKEGIDLKAKLEAELPKKS